MRTSAVLVFAVLLMRPAFGGDGLDWPGGPFDPHAVRDPRSHVVCPVEYDGFLRASGGADGDDFRCAYQRHIVELGHNIIQIHVFPAASARTLDSVFAAARAGSAAPGAVYRGPDRKHTHASVKSAFYVDRYYGRSNTTAVYAGYRRGWFVTVTINFPGMPDKAQADRGAPYLPELSAGDRALAPKVFLAALDQIGH
jgi:hypothetical protein